MKSKKHRELPEFEIIQAAIEGDAEAINQILSYFQPFINSECKREYKDEFGRVHYVVDEYMKRRMETKLITKILDFKIVYNKGQGIFPFYSVSESTSTLIIEYFILQDVKETVEPGGRYARMIQHQF